MRARIAIPIVIVVIAGAVLVVALSRREASGSGASGSPGATALAARTITAGSVEVGIVPIRLDDTGAVFQVSLDTHTGDLAVNLAEGATLKVGGSTWKSPVWKGDPPGGHHRQGELSFTPAGIASGKVTLTIDGLPGPVVATWSLPAV